LVVCLGVVGSLGWDKIRTALVSVRWPILLAMVVVDIGALWTRALKWRYVTGPGKGAIGLFFMAKAAGNWSPGRFGELLPVLLPAHRNAFTAGWIVFDMLLEILTTLTVGTTGLLFYRGVAFSTRYIVALSCFALVIVSMLWVITRKELLARLAQTAGRGHRLKRVLSIAALVSAEVVTLKSKLPMILSLTALAMALELGGNILLYAAFGWTVPLAAIAMAKCAHGLVAAVPFTPSISGVPYLAVGVLLNQAVGVPSQTLAVAMAMKEALANIVFWSSFGVATVDMAAGKQESASS
jgi:hypothetical protein